MTPTVPYYIVIRRTNQVLLSFTQLRVIVNGTEIYPLLNESPVVIPITYNYPKVVVTDGFHFTRPVELTYEQPSYYRFKVSCAIDDLQLLGGSFLLVLFYLLGFYTGIFWLKLVSFVPIVTLIIVYYLRRKSFIRLIPVRN